MKKEMQVEEGTKWMTLWFRKLLEANQKVYGPWFIRFTLG